MKTILAIDPGTIQSAYVLWDGSKVIDFDLLPNSDILKILTAYSGSSHLVIEQIRCYGQAVGASTIDTVFWSGRFAQHWLAGCGEYSLVPRMDVKMHLCHTSRAKDSNIRQALIDRFGEPGTKKNPGLTYGLKKDIWQAFALAVHAYDKQLADEQKEQPCSQKQ